MPASTGNPLRVLICYGGLGAAWVIAPARVTQHLPAYQPALRLAGHVAFGFYPFRVWGGLLVILAVGVAWSLRHPHTYSWGWSTAMCMFWTFWVVEFTVAACTSGGTWSAPFYALIPAWYAFGKGHTATTTKAVARGRLNPRRLRRGGRIPSHRTRNVVAPTP